MSADLPAASPKVSLTLLGRPVAHWLFGLRTWAAMMLALYAAFWLQVPDASDAAVTAAILGLPTRGHVLGKALNRLAGTVAGVAASLVIMGLFNDLRTPFLVSAAAWQGLCTYACGRLDGYRAYGVVLSGYTVAFVAIGNIDAPQAVFLDGIERGFSIALGVAATALVSDLFPAPVLPSLIERLEAAHHEIRAFTLGAVERGATDAVEVGRLLTRLTALRTDAEVLPAESVAGWARAAAARRAISESVRKVRAARILSATLAHAGEQGEAWRDRMAATFKCSNAAERLLEDAARLIADEKTSPPQLVVARSAEAVVRCDLLVAEAVCDLRTGRGPVVGPRLRLYRSRRSAARDALRMVLALLICSALLVVAGLPSASTCLLYVFMFGGLSSTSPDPRGYVIAALIAMPLSVATAGVIEFLVLNGADDFPLLAMALLPLVLVGGLLATSGRPLLASVGAMLNIFTPIMMSLANPQRYDPASYLNQGLFLVVAAGLLGGSIYLLLPTDDARRRCWMLSAARREMLEAAHGRRSRLSVGEASYETADRLGQLAALSYGDPVERDRTVAHALRLSELTFSARTLHEALAGVREPAARDALTALAVLDPAGLQAAAERLCADERWRWAGANAARMAALVERYAADVTFARDAVRRTSFRSRIWSG